MPKLELNLENLKDLGDGKIQVAFGLELQRALKDCLNRPNEKKARKVTLEVSATPIAQEGECEGVNVAFDIKSTVPARRTQSYPLKITTAGQAWWMAESEEEAEQNR